MECYTSYVPSGDAVCIKFILYISHLHVHYHNSHCPHLNFAEEQSVDYALEVNQL